MPADSPALLEVLMNFTEIIKARQSCRNFDPDREVPEDALSAILEAARLAPSACNGQPYHITVCKGDVARAVAKGTQGMGMNKFASNAPLMLVISERPYCAVAALGSRVKGNDYRSIDIGIVAAYMTSEATARGLESCMLGWLDSDKIRAASGADGVVRLVIALGYAKDGDKLREKKRKKLSELVSFKGE